MPREAVTVPGYLSLAGAVLAAAGTYVPWIVTNPRVQVVPAIHLNGMGYRVAGSDFLVLGVLVAGLAAAARYRRTRRGGNLAAATGALVAVLSVVVVFASLDGFLGTFVPGPGVVLTVVGGGLLVVAGWRHRSTHGDEAADRPRGRQVEGR